MRLLQVLAVASFLALSLVSTAQAARPAAHVVGLVNTCAPWDAQSSACSLGVEARLDVKGGVSGHLIAQGAFWDVVELVQYSATIWCLSAVPRAASPEGAQRIAVGFTPGTDRIHLETTTSATFADPAQSYCDWMRNSTERGITPGLSGGWGGLIFTTP
jgi:hypothetical protein